MGIAAYLLGRHGRPTIAPMEPAQEFPSIEPADPRLDRIIEAVDFDQTPMADVLARLTELGGIEFAWRWPDAAPLNPATAVTVHLRKLPLRRVIESVLGVAGKSTEQAWFVQDGRIIVSTQDSAFRSTKVTRVYDIGPLLDAEDEGTVPLDRLDPRGVPEVNRL